MTRATRYASIRADLWLEAHVADADAQVFLPGRPHPEFTPKKVIYTILMGDGRKLTADSLYPFSQVTLAHAARVLGSYGIDVEVIGIPAAV